MNAENYCMLKNGKEQPSVFFTIKLLPVDYISPREDIYIVKKMKHMFKLMSYKMG